MCKQNVVDATLDLKRDLEEFDRTKDRSARIEVLRDQFRIALGLTIPEYWPPQMRLFNETPGVHRGSRKRGGVVGGGAGTATGDARDWLTAVVAELTDVLAPLVRARGDGNPR
jgi:hypothetical protein